MAPSSLASSPAMSGRKTGLTVTRVDEVLAHIRKTIAVTSSVARCDSCLNQTVVHRLG
jgi:hypothetical protein